ncbi:Fucose 4-O-acetylase [Thermomonospora echinospora]|uniref:Fucose 4-O-acetylase n=1 Tax=Thermomonospora echinospora TaxID=1992 RepID=A0A1H5WEW4_9ACTN|nr:acyltransferase family protein [Thermomonospora echinospora]SEF98002.1 Fucose 4-O-acetylase [Thermomonospora echinospora]
MAIATEHATEHAAESTAEPARAPAKTAARPARDPFFDNAKFLAIVLVVVFHAVEGLRDVPAVRAAYVFVYMFHMPVFIVLTGYLSQRFTFSPGRTRKLVTTLVVPYVIFEIGYSVYFWSRSGGKPLDISLLRSSYLMWFLMALFLWRLSTPLWQQIRWPLGFAVGISLLSFMTELPPELTLQRTLGLLPFYVLGLMLRPEHFAPLKRPRARVLGAVTLLVAFAGAATVGRDLPHKWVYWNHGHEALGLDNVSGTLMRAAMLVAAMVLVAAFLAVVPARRTWFTALGSATLYAYLLHGFGVQGLKALGVYDVEWLHTVPGAVVLAAGAAVAGTLLCSGPVVRATRWLVEPRIPWIFPPPSAGHGPAMRPRAGTEH